MTRAHETEIKRALKQLETRESDWPRALFFLFERIRDEGGVAIIKLDGERTHPDALPYTCLVSRGRIDERHLRRDDRSALAAARWCLLEYFQA